MSQQPHVGLSLINKAPTGILITLLIAVLANVWTAGDCLWSRNIANALLIKAGFDGPP